MRVLHIVNDLSDKGNGIINVCVDLALEQKRMGYEVAVAADHGEYIDLLRSHGVTYFPLPQRRTVPNLFKALVRLGRVFGTFEPEIVHAHMRTGLLLAWVCSRVPRRALVAHLHNVHDRESRIMKIADLVITVSESVRESMKAYIPLKKMVAVANGPLRSVRNLPIDKIVPRKLQHPAILSVAGLNHRKGIAILLKAFDILSSEWPEAHLYLVGDGPERELFEAQARSLSLRERVHFERHQADPQSYMLASDVFALASLRDSNPLVLFEAREAGCAIVASNVDGIPETLEFGIAGMLVPSSDPDALSSAIGALLRDAPKREALRDRARANLDRYSCKRFAVDIEEAYLRIEKSLAND